MKKRKRYIYFFVLILFICGLLIFVKSRYFKESDKTIDMSEKVEVQIEKESITKEGLKMSITNNLSKKVYYTGSYDLEIYRFGKWFKVPPILKKHQVVTVLGYETSIETKTLFQVNWRERYGEIGGGRYRVIIKIYTNKSNDEKNTIYVASEFTIN